MPSDANNYQFEYDSSSGKTTQELNELLRIPARPKAFPQDLQYKKKSDVTMSYTILGTKPKRGLTEDAVTAMEKEDELRKEEIEMAMKQADGWDELWGIREWKD
jgi:hypothetical protein